MVWGPQTGNPQNVAAITSAYLHVLLYSCYILVVPCLDYSLEAGYGTVLGANRNCLAFWSKRKLSKIHTDYRVTRSPPPNNATQPLHSAAMTLAEHVFVGMEGLVNWGNACAIGCGVTNSVPAEAL